VSPSSASPPPPSSSFPQSLHESYSQGYLHSKQTPQCSSKVPSSPGLLLLKLLCLNIPLKHINRAHNFPELCSNNSSFLQLRPSHATTPTHTPLFSCPSQAASLCPDVYSCVCLEGAEMTHPATQMPCNRSSGMGWACPPKCVTSLLRLQPLSQPHKDRSCSSSCAQMNP
jgi:hypothetical protein